MTKQNVFEGFTDKNNPLLIRYPTLEDAQLMAEYLTVLSEEKTFVSFQGEKISTEDEKKSLVSILENIEKSKSIFLLAFVNNTLVGIANIDQSKRVNSHIGGLAISVSKDFRREGVGSRFLDVLIKQVKKNIPEIKIITLEVFSNNETAIKLYEKYGFKEFGRLPEGIKYKDTFVDSVYMYKKL